MVIPCTVTDHKLVAGKGYFYILGDRPAQTRSAFVKYASEVALSGPAGVSTVCVLDRGPIDSPGLRACVRPSRVSAAF